MKNYLPGLLAMCLAACGGGSDSTGGGSTGGTQQPDLSLNQLYSAYDAIAAEQAGLGFTQASQLPTTSATYTGYGANSLTSSTRTYDTAISLYQVSADIDFAAGTWTGTGSNFVSTTTNASVDGSLSASGTLGQTGGQATLSGTYSGRIVEGGQRVTYQGTIGGNFLGPNGEQLAGRGSGTAAFSAGVLPIYTVYRIKR